MGIIWIYQEKSIKNDLKDKQKKLDTVFSHRAAVVYQTADTVEYEIDPDEEPDAYQPWVVS